MMMMINAFNFENCVERTVNYISIHTARGKLLHGRSCHGLALSLSLRRKQAFYIKI